MPVRSIAAWATLKGLTVAIVTAAAGLDLPDSLLVAGVSGGLGVIGMVWSAKIAGSEARKNREAIHDIKQKVGAANRATDIPPNVDP